MKIQMEKYLVTKADITNACDYLMTNKMTNKIIIR